MRQFVKASFTTVSMRHSILLGLIFMVLSVPAAYAGIADSLHNFSTSNTNPAGSNEFTGTGEICVFCHTPHGGDTTAPVPLWNRTLGTNTYQTYDQLGTSTLDGKVAAVGSISIACLSCHDGTQALDAIINAPGSGLVNTDFTNGNWSGDNVDPDGTLRDGAITNIGLDLRNDHPVGIQYGGGGIDSNDINGATNDVDFFQPTPLLVGTTQTWYLEASNNSQRDKEDVILFSRPSSDFGTAGGAVEPSVECGSCHDPHQTANPTFLRVTSNGSQICLTCHNK